MRICFITEKEILDIPWWENRFSAFLDAGHELHIICYRYNREILDNLKGRVIFHELRDVHHSNKFNWLISLLFFFNLEWIIKISRIIKKYQINIIGAYNLPTYLTALIIGRICRVPVVFEMVENWPHLINLLGHFQSINPLYAPLINLKRYERVEVKCCRKAKEIIVSGKGSREKLISRGIACEKISIVNDVPNLKTFQAIAPAEDIVVRYASKFIITYFGVLALFKGVDTLIRAMSLVIKRIPQAHLLLIGDGKDKSEFENLTQRLKLEKDISFIGWVDYKILMPYYYITKVGIIPWHLNPQNLDKGIKLFEYMAIGKPQVVTDLPEQAAIVKEANCGIIVPPNDPQSMAEAIITLYDNPELAERLGRNGRKAAEQKYNWDIEKEKYLKPYETCISFT